MTGLLVMAVTADTTSPRRRGRVSRELPAPRLQMMSMGQPGKGEGEGSDTTVGISHVKILGVWMVSINCSCMPLYPYCTRTQTCNQTTSTCKSDKIANARLNLLANQPSTAQEPKTRKRTAVDVDKVGFNVLIQELGQPCHGIRVTPTHLHTKVTLCWVTLEQGPLAGLTSQ
jgi:hypothetical protein